MNKKVSKSIGEMIRKARKESGISQRELADSLQLSDKAISSYEVGRTTPSFNLLKEIGKIVHKPINYFDVEANNDDLDLQIQLKTIERELLKIKRALKKKGKI